MAAYRLGGKAAVLAMLNEVPLGELEHSWDDPDNEGLLAVLRNMGCRTA